MRLLACLPLALLFGCGQQPEGPAAGQPGQFAAAPDLCNPASACAALDRALVTREARAQQAARARLRTVLEFGPGDPVADARRAAGEGNFRLFWRWGGWEHRSVVGVACRFPTSHPATSSEPLALIVRYYPDYSSPEGLFVPGHRYADLIERRFDAYASSYNRTMIAEPSFPYHDLCGLQQPGLPPNAASLDLPERLAAPHSDLTETPRTLGEAARRGSRASVERMLRGHAAAELDRPDDFGLTPLAWAVIERRGDIATLLIAHGADPLDGWASLRGPGLELPLSLALATGQLGLADEMLTPDAVRRLTPWPVGLMRSAARGGHVALVRRMLREPHNRVRQGELRVVGGRPVSPAMLRLIEQALPEPRRRLARPAPRGPARRGR